MVGRNSVICSEIGSNRVESGEIVLSSDCIVLRLILTIWLQRLGVRFL